MSSVSDFVAAAVKADPSLAGESDKDRAAVQKLEAEAPSLAKDLSALNERLTPLTFLHSNSPTTADVSLFCHVHPSMVSAPPSQHPTHPSLLRYFLHVQSLPSVQSAQSSLPNAFPPLDIDIASLPAPERKEVVPPPKKEKKDKKPAAASTEGVVAQVSAAASAVTETVTAAAGSVAAAVGLTSEGDGAAKAVGGKSEKKQKKEKKEKPPAPAKAEPAAPAPSMIDMRVGKVLDVKKHPEADSLYVEQIDVGEAEPRTVCSGLVKYMTEDEIRGKNVIVICNLKPVTMRGVKSYAMLLCATSKDGKEEGGVQFVLPPADSGPGERIYFEGEKFESAKPEEQLNPKKKVFETIQPNFTTLENLEAAWVDPETKTVHRIRTQHGVCRAVSFVGASLS